MTFEKTIKRVENYKKISKPPDLELLIYENYKQQKNSHEVRVPISFAKKMH
jgi:hypothetical protein